MKLPVSVIILAYNEEKNIEACLKSISYSVDEIFVVDSFSNDKTLEITKKYTDKIYQNPFKTQAQQFAWALGNIPIKNDWVMRLDADERWTPEALNELSGLLKDPELSGIYIKLRIYFMHRWIKYGGFYPNYFLRVFRRSKGGIESRMMDEHIKVDGKTVILKNDVIEYNLKDRNGSMEEFILKHADYARREAIDYFKTRYGHSDNNTIADINGGKTEQKRYIKENFYYKAPKFLRVFMYFLYRYFFRLGFLDGKEGLIFHFLQGFWYRFLVDAKIYEIEKKAKKENKPVKEVIKEMYGIEV